MTGAALERARTANVDVMGDTRRGRQLVAKANIYANGEMVPKAMQGKPDVVLAGMLTCLRLGYSEDAVPQLHCIESGGSLHVEPPGQMYLGAVHNAGFETTVLRSDNEACVVEISEPGRDPLTISFTIEDAQRAGLLDQWVERWQRTDLGKNYKEKFLLGRPGVDVPDWVNKEIRAGRTCRMDNWWKWPADQLFAKAAKRVVRRYAPEVMFGIAADVQQVADGQVSVVDDDEVVDGEIVPARPGDEAGAVERENPPSPAPASAFAPESSKRALLAMIASLDPGHQARLREAVKGRFPKVDGPLFTVDHLAQMLTLVDEAMGDDSSTVESPTVEDAGGASRGRPTPPATTPADELERPFE